MKNANLATIRTIVEVQVRFIDKVNKIQILKLIPEVLIVHRGFLPRFVFLAFFFDTHRNSLD
jgi:hypothetical protein